MSRSATPHPEVAVAVKAGQASERISGTAALSSTAASTLSESPASPQLRYVDAPVGVGLAEKHIHFVGIGGCGMSGLARMVQARGATCTGSDHADSSTIETLMDDGFAINLTQTADSVPADCDTLVISAAIPDTHPEVIEANRRGIRVVKYARMLGELMVGRTGIAVAGTHGKSSTTSLLSHILIQADRDPSFIVGANCEQIGGGSRCGKSDVLIAEACEFDRSFHNLNPTLAVILNIEEDHLDYYKDLDEINESFAHFAKQLPDAKDGGLLLVEHEMAQRPELTADLKCQVQTIGFDTDADWRVEFEQVEGQSTTQLFFQGDKVAEWNAPLPGKHMTYNACVAAVLAHHTGAEWKDIQTAVSTFHGLDRRMQWMGTRRSLSGPADEPVNVVDDYGHHPTEVLATLKSLRDHYQPNRMICVFQPHQHSRTRFLLEEFAKSFDDADIVIVPHIYFVRDSEQERHAVRAADLVDRLRQRNRKAYHVYPFEAIVEHLELQAQPGDLIVTMGAGDVWRVAESFLR